jgi:hypothetical protein
MFALSEVAAFYFAAAERCVPELEAVVETVVGDAALRARSFIGVQQSEFLPLSSATVYGFHRPGYGWILGKAERGFSGPDYQPLLGDSGDMGDSIEAGLIAPLTGMVGSDSKIALYQEIGTPGADYPIPPRPVLAKGLLEAEVMIEPLCGEVAISLLMP